MKPEWISGASYSWSVLGRSGVFWSVRGLCRSIANDLKGIRFMKIESHKR